MAHFFYKKNYLRTEGRDGGQVVSVLALYLTIRVQIPVKSTVSRLLSKTCQIVCSCFMPTFAEEIIHLQEGCNIKHFSVISLQT